MTTTIQIPGCPGYSINLGPDHQMYALALAERATMRSGHPWVDTWDAELEALVLKVWAKVVPGWITADSENNHGIHAHYAILHHLWWAGHQLLDPQGQVMAPVGGLRSLG